MHRINPRLYNNYVYWSSELAGYQENAVNFGITLDTILRSHYLLCDFFLREGEAIAAPGPRDKTLLLSAIDRQSVGFDGKTKWNDLYHISATLFYGIVKNHPFHDGNKRTGLLAALHQLEKGGRIINTKKKDFENLAVKTAAGQLNQYSTYGDFAKKGDGEVRTIAHFFRKNTRPIDSSYVRITYNQLIPILRRHGFECRGPDNNKLDIIRKTTSKKWLGKPKIKEQLIIQVGCPRITTQINPKAIKSILKACDLTPENGYDSEVIFNGADPLDFLIEEFQDPLRRLKDR